jgi:hypothetical protein
LQGDGLYPHLAQQVEDAGQLPEEAVVFHPEGGWKILQHLAQDRLNT